MSSLLPNHHRSTSDRLLNNYLSSQKQLTTALLTLLSHSHSSTSSLLAYVTSSSGVAYPVRRSVQHAAFEGPMNQDTGEDYDSINGNATEAKWHEYIGSLEHFRKELKDVHLLEEELSQVKKDREILVSRLIKATKSRPTKADIAAAAKASNSHAGSESGRTRPSNSSVLSFGSDHSNTTAGGGKSKRAEKLAEAQAEVLGCEEHLRGLEVRLEQERNKVMKHGLMERFRAMEDVGRMWQRQARLGMAELQSSNGGGHDGPMLHPNAYEVESNGSIAPSQSASQVGYNSDGEQERRQRSHGRGGHVPGMAGSVTGSIAEEDENSSSDDDENLVVHENKRPGVGTGGNDFRSRSQSTIVPTGNNQSSGQGVPSITNIKAKPVTRRQNSGSSGSSVARGPGRRTQSELGYNPPRARQNRMSIRRTPSRGAMSDASSDRSVGRRGGGKKKGGFFASIAKIFKGKSGGSTAGSTRGARRGGADSPPLTQRNTGGWSTRTDDNIRRAVSNAGTGRGVSSGRRTRNADYSSSDDEMGGGNLVAVTNRGNNTWSVDNAGRKNGAAAATPAAAGTVGKTGKSRSDLGAGTKARSNSQNTITQTGGKVTSKPPGVASQPVSRSNTVKSTTSGVGAGSRRTRHGSITRVGARGSTMGAPPSIAGVLGEAVPKAPSSATAGSKPAQNKSTEIPKAPGSSIVPKMGEIPKAPGSQVTPQMYMATAPPPNKAPLLQPPPPQMSNSASAPVGLSDGYVPKAAASSVSKASKASKATITPKTAQQTQPQQQQQQQQAPAQITKSSSALASLNLGAPVGMSQANESVDSIATRATTPLPPSKTLSPPAKSAMRASSPIPQGSPVFEAPPPAFMISAPGSVIKEKPKEEEVPVKLPEPTVPAPQAQQPRAERPSTPATMTDADSVYESAVEEDNSDNERPNNVNTSQAVATNGNADDDNDDGSSVASDSTAGPGQSKYKVVENTEGLAARMRQAGNASEAPAPVAAPAEPVAAAPEKPKEVAKDEYVTPAAPSMTGSAIERRKSVRMNVPPSPGTPITEGPPDSPTPESKRESGWSSRIGRTADSSDEEDNAAYAKARRSMNRYSSLSASKPATTTTTSSSTTTKKKKKSTKA